MAPWLAAGRDRGYRSSAACPFRVKGEPRGVLTLYAGAPGIFTAEVRALLEELAADVGLGLELGEAEQRRQQAEAALAASESAWRRLFIDNPGPMLIYDRETLRILAVNDAAVDLYGYSRDELLARTIRDIRPPEDLPALEAHLAAPSTGLRKSGVWRHLTKEGRVVEVEVESHDVAFEGRAGRLVLVTDQTERLRILRELTESQEKFRAFFDSGAFGSLFGDVHGNVLAANDEYLRIVGYAKEELDAGLLKWSEITPPNGCRSTRSGSPRPARRASAPRTRRNTSGATGRASRSSSGTPSSARSGRNRSPSSST